MKRIFFLCLILILAFTVPVLADKKDNNDVVFADDKPTEIFVVGEYENTIEADIVNIDFFVKYNSDNFVDGQNYVSNMYSCLCKKLQAIDTNIGCNICYMTYKPITKENTQYCFEQCYHITSTKLDKLQEIIQSSDECGINGYNRITYELKNKKELFDEAINSALKDAKTKAQKMIDNATLYRIFGNDVCCYEYNNQILIKANVRALFVSSTQQDNTITPPDLVNREIIVETNKF